jgi:hypothetical protein
MPQVPIGKRPVGKCKSAAFGRFSLGGALPVASLAAAERPWRACPDSVAWAVPVVDENRRAEEPQPQPQPRGWGARGWGTLLIHPAPTPTRSVSSTKYKYQPPRSGSVLQYGVRKGFVTCKKSNPPPCWALSRPIRHRN